MTLFLNGGIAAARRGDDRKAGEPSRAQGIPVEVVSSVIPKPDRMAKGRLPPS